MATQTQTASAATINLTPHSADIPRGPVTADFNFYKAPADGSKPFNYVGTPPEGQPQRNHSDIIYPILVNDLRGQESSFDLDTHAFSAVTDVPSAANRKTFDDDDEVKRIYYPEVEELLLKETGAKRVLLFDHTIRLATPGASRAPVMKAHIDQTPESATARVHHHLPSEAETLLKDRVRIINVWRPLNPPVVSHPLAFAESKSLPDEGLVGIEHRYPDRTGETAAVKKVDGTKWWYWSGMQDGERLLLQCYDSETGGRVPHTAFTDSRSPPGSQRESIEVRALVFG